MTVLDKLTYASNPGNTALLPEGRTEFVVGYICDAALLEKSVPGHDAIVHYAAELHNDSSIADPESLLRAHMEGTHRLFEACRKFNIRYHCVSTDGVFGYLALDNSVRFTEKTPYHHPSNPYSSTKAVSEASLRARLAVPSHGLRKWSRRHDRLVLRLRASVAPRQSCARGQVRQVRQVRTVGR